MREILFEVDEIKLVAKNIFMLRLKGDNLPDIKGGQFIELETRDPSLVLRRPFCIYEACDNLITLYIAIAGAGTLSLSQLKKGDKLNGILPLGNGFDVSNYKKVGLLGGGMGVAALHLLARQNKNVDFYAYLGFSNKDRVLFVEDFEKVCKEVKVYTSDGSYGLTGHPVAPIANMVEHLDAIMVCGPHRLVKAAQSMGEFSSLPVFASLEQRMACGIGACMVCTCNINGEHKRVCADGPVFRLNEIRF